MPLLHTVNKSPFDRNSLDACMRLAAKGSSVLLIEDGIYGAIKNTDKSDLITKAMNDISFYVLGPDLKARGISEDKLISGVNIVGYGDFVDLVEQHSATQAWL